MAPLQATQEHCLLAIGQGGAGEARPQNAHVWFSTALGARNGRKGSSPPFRNRAPFSPAESLPDLILGVGVDFWSGGGHLPTLRLIINVAPGTALSQPMAFCRNPVPECNSSSALTEYHGGLWHWNCRVLRPVRVGPVREI